MINVYIDGNGSTEGFKTDIEGDEFRDTYWQSVLIDVEGRKKFSTLVQYMGEKDYMGFHLKLRERSKLGTFIQKLYVAAKSKISKIRVSFVR